MISFPRSLHQKLEQNLRSGDLFPRETERASFPVDFTMIQMLLFGYIESLNFYLGNSNISLMNVIDVSGQEQDYGVRAHIQPGSPTDRHSIP